MVKYVILAFTALIFSGCTTGHWYKEGATLQEYQEANYLCLKEAQQPQSTSTAYINTQSTSTAYINTQYTTEPFYKSDSSSSMVTNQTLYTACMNAYGFYWITDSSTIPY